MATVAQYLAGIASARGLYIWLYRDAVGMLPPADSEEDAALESRTALVGVAKELEMPPWRVGRELRRLVNYGWVRSRAMPRYLGRRKAGVVYLLADVQAEDATGERCLVSRLVLKVEPVAVPERPRSATRSRTGAGRRWQKATEWTWGDQRAEDARPNPGT